jgi:NAD(P)-dependent dehydrogenase (short-subunit alcohol dehydrogenase family)
MPASSSRSRREYSAEDYEHVVGVNLTGFFNITQRAIAEMMRRGRGHVVNITTTLVDSQSRACRPR